jgi:quercetin dioxygenase-like cupin family protein
MIQEALAAMKLEGMEGDHRWWMGCLATIKVTSAQSSGRFSLVECILPPELPVPAHIHTAQDETFYILEGEIAFRIDGTAMTARPGDLVFVPRGTAHEFAATSATPARYLFLHSPGGFDEFVRVSSQPAPAPTLPPPEPPPTPDQINSFIALMARYGMQPA